MYYILRKHNQEVFDPVDKRWRDFDHIGQIKPYKQWVTAIEQSHKLEDGGILVGADEIIKILLDKGDTVQILRGGMQEKRNVIEELTQRLDHLTIVNVDLLKILKMANIEDIQTDVSYSEESIEVDKTPP